MTQGTAQRAYRAQLTSLELCIDCSSALDTMSRLRCRQCLDKARNQRRRQRNIQQIRTPNLCRDCWEIGHKTGYCQFARKGSLHHE